MIFANLRASAWKWGCVACAVLAVAAVVYCLFLRTGAVAAAARADTAESRATALQGQLRAAQAAARRDTASDTATRAAEVSAEQRQAERTERSTRVEGIAREPRPAVPAVCPGPDPRLVRELAEGTARLRAAEGRLRSLDTAAHPRAGSSGAD